MASEPDLMRLLESVALQPHHGTTPVRPEPSRNPAAELTQVCQGYGCETDLFKFLLQAYEASGDERMTEAVKQIAAFLNLHGPEALKASEGRTVSDFVYPVV